MINIFWPHSHKNGVSDQLWCLETMFSDLGVPYTVSDRMDPISKNILIENILPETAAYVNRFCATHKRKVIVVPTEFLELPSGEKQVFYINGDLITDFKRGASPFVERMKGLADIRENVEAFVSLADQPSLGEYCSAFGIPLSFQLGLPNWKIDLAASRNCECDYDLYFSGALTRHREDQLRMLTNRFNVLFEGQFVHESQRIRQLKRCSYNLNIIQEPSWKWLSTMRVLFGLRHGKLTLQPSAVPLAPLSEFVVEIQDGAKLSDLVDAKLEQYKLPFSLVELNPRWTDIQHDFIRYCEA